MRSFKDVADRHQVSLDNKQLAMLTSAAVVAAGLFFLTGVLYGTRVSIPAPPGSSGQNSLALRLDKDEDDVLPAVQAPQGSASTVVPVTPDAKSRKNRAELLDQYSRESVVVEQPVAPPAAAAPAPKSGSGASQPAKPIAQVRPEAPKPAAVKPVAEVQPAKPVPEKSGAKPATQVASASPAVSAKDPGQPLLRGRPLSGMKGPLSIQVAAFTDKASAQKELERWEKGRFPAFMGLDTVGGKRIYRIQVGRFSDRAEAERARTALERDMKVVGPRIIDAVK
ncbi:MAG: SPOR domain-containing protein [Deltaproteobacteria bacterium]|nr:SPOR domain-containing protein [Deltaproteobacteria bacterium]